MAGTSLRLGETKSFTCQINKRCFIRLIQICLLVFLFVKSAFWMFAASETNEGQQPGRVVKTVTINYF